MRAVAVRASPNLKLKDAKLDPNLDDHPAVASAHLACDHLAGFRLVRPTLDGVVHITTHDLILRKAQSTAGFPADFSIISKARRRAYCLNLAARGLPLVTRFGLTVFHAGFMMSRSNAISLRFNERVQPRPFEPTMFTSEPSLAQRIERMIADTPIIDPRTQIHCDQPNAPDLASLLSYHGVQTELRAVGMPATDFAADLPADERVRRAIPYLRQTRNTAVSWCLYRILRDLFDFFDPVLTESNYRDLFDAVAKTGQDPTWAPTVLGERCHIESLVTSFANRSNDPAKNPANVRFTLDLHTLFCPGAATRETTKTKAGYYESLVALLGERPATTASLARLLGDWLDRTITGPVRFTNTHLPIEQRFSPPDEIQAQRVLTQAANQGALTDQDIDILVQLVTWQILGWHHDHQKAIQLTVGNDCASLPRFQESWTSEMARAFQQFRQARFDLLVASDVLTQETAVLTRQLPNVYASGYWQHNFVPATIETTFGMRVQISPMTKFGGFLSDAPYAEWTYGNLQVVKKAIAASLSQLVTTGYYEETDLPALFQQILHDTPRDLYNLG